MNDILQNFSKVKVLVVGDVMLDRYWWGTVSRISPEAPVPIVNLERETFVLGGAANVAANIRGLGATPILVGVIGDDADGRILSNALEESGIASRSLAVLQNRPTTVKTRIIAHQQQVARIDSETKENLSVEAEKAIGEKLKVLLEEADVILLSDYSKGLLNNGLAPLLINEAKERGKKIFVDPKGKDYGKYRDATVLTPNRKEAIDALPNGFAFQNLRDAGEKLLDDLRLESLLITQGEDGMSIFEREGKFTHLEALARHVYDVTGAGDTVIATLAVAVAAGANLVEAAKLANVAAGYVVGEVGTTTITFAELYREFQARTQ